MLQWMMGGFVAFMVLVLGMTLFPTIGQVSHDNKVDAVTAESLSCTTGAAATSCTITLANAHQHGDTTHMTITETQQGLGNVTSSVSVGLNRQALTVSGLSAGTAYTFSANYERRPANVDANDSSLFTLTPYLWLGGILAIVVIIAWFLVKRVTG